jgi:hypothetical protein
MKKYLNPFHLILLFSLPILISCTKTELQEQLNATGTESSDLRCPHPGGHHNGGNNCPNPHSANCHNPHCNVPGCPNNNCPSSVATATGYTFNLDMNSAPPEVGIDVDVFYSNPGPAGTFRVVLRNNSNIIDTSWIIPAVHVDTGGSASFHIQRFVDFAGFPYYLEVTGRPTNLQCPLRSSVVFYIYNES